MKKCSTIINAEKYATFSDNELLAMWWMEGNHNNNDMEPSPHVLDAIRNLAHVYRALPKQTSNLQEEEIN